MKILHWNWSASEGTLYNNTVYLKDKNKIKYLSVYNGLFYLNSTLGRVDVPMINQLFSTVGCLALN